jgi:starch synthase (maltosyl-transferring)
MKAESRPLRAISPAVVSGDESLFYIEQVYPCLDGGRFAVKRIVGERIEVWADIFRDGHELSQAVLVFRREGEPVDRREIMRHIENDRWVGSFMPDALGRYLFAIEAWTDRFGTWRRDFRLKQQAGQDTKIEFLEGRELLEEAFKLSKKSPSRDLIRSVREAVSKNSDPERLLSDELAAAMADVQPKTGLTRSREFPVVIDRAAAQYSAWYEIFPRSQSTHAAQHGTFGDCIRRLPDIAAMGFDVLYFPPIHPIGRTNRKGRNNANSASAGDAGSPYAIGAEEGGHDAIHPELGTLAEFRALIAACHDHGMELALDFATQCSPDHPWIKQHPEWFKRRPDGSIKYAENPPKKYEDIHNPDFCCADKGALWLAFQSVIFFWIDQGVRIFRVDNPHTKPFPFWEWLIQSVQARNPDVIFLSEAFTRPKLMKALAKLGFTQSYTYFTWRTDKAALSSYMAELTGYPEREYFRPNFFVNTPDILPYHLQSGESWMFKARVALAATLSSNYGVYGGFELLEHEAVPGKDEYLNSEKYEIKPRDWMKPGNIRDYIATLNNVRRRNPALQQTQNIRLAQIDDGEVLGFVKESATADNAVAVAISLARQGPREFWFHFGDMKVGPPSARRPISAIENLLTGERHSVEWGGVRLRLDPWANPALLFRCI